MHNIILKDETVERVVFHFNKRHNIDQTVPPWVVKHKGKSYYVNHLDSKVGFSTKETPASNHTKATLMFMGKLNIIEENNTTTAVIYL